MEQRLSNVLADFARTLTTDFPIQAILDHLVVTIVEVLPVDAAGVTLISPGSSPHFIAASDASALCFEELQTELWEGPCLAAYETGEAVAIPDLTHDAAFPRFASRATEAGLVAVFAFPLRQENGRLGALDLYCATPGPLNPEAMAAAQTLADVTTAYLMNAQARADLTQSSEVALENSLHDSLTGLPNRTLLLNDSYGHQIGDELLIAVADRISRLLRPGDTVARPAGDEFIILCDDLDMPSQAELLANRVGTALSRPFQLSDIEVQLSASVGIAFAGQGSDVPEQIIQDADTAMYQAKRKGGARYGTIDLGEQHLASRRTGLTRDLRHAGVRGELWLGYQPIVAIDSGQIIGVEALLPWDHPTQGAIAPEVTVPLAERSGLIVGLGRWVMEQAFLDRQHWLRHGGRPGLAMSVNISVHQLIAPGFVDLVSGVIADTGTDPAMVTLEVTESVLIRDSGQALLVLKSLKNIGAELALDDFGTGNSSLGYLKEFPVDGTKIDRSFIVGLKREATSRLIVDAVVGLAHGLDMTVVAEGVESIDQLDDVTAMGVDCFQGYYFARPMPADEVAIDQRFLAPAGI